MSATLLSPNMNITVPVASEQSGPTWATNVQNALYLTIDQHDHTPGNGVQLGVASFSIDGNFPLNGNDLTTARTIRYTPQASSIAGISPFTSCVYVAPNGGSGVYDLWYNDGAGNSIPITKNGAVTGTPGSITGLPSGTASASFASTTFTFQSATSTAASVDCRNIVLRNSTTSSNALTISPPDAMGANIAMKMPTIPASSTSIMQMGTSGTMTAALVADGTSITTSGDVLQIPTSGVTTAKIAALNVTRAKLVAVGQQVSSTCNSGATPYSTSSATYTDVTNLTVTLTPTGRPVVIMVLPGDDVANGYWGNTSAATYDAILVRTQSAVATVLGGVEQIQGVGLDIPLSFLVFDTTYTADVSLTYKVQVKTSAGTVVLNRIRLAAYEL